VRKKIIVGMVAIALTVGLAAVLRPAEAKAEGDCGWAVQQYNHANRVLQSCADRFGWPTQPGDQCWNAFSTREHFSRLVQISCQMHEE